MLLGRSLECAALDELMNAVRAGQSRVLVLRGEPGVGKTVLLEYAADPVSGFRFTRAAGVESERELVYAGLHQLCEPLLGDLDGLPVPQRAALETAFGFAAGGPPDGFLVGLAVLSLLSGAAAEQPLLCVVDDAQWPDAASAQVLAFVARRLHAESVALLVSVRDPSEADQFAGLPELRVNGLADPDAHSLLASAVLGPLDQGVVERIIAETGGNPLALLELPRGRSPAELAGGFGLTTALALPGQIERSFRRRLEPLPAATQRLLLLAAAEPVGDAALLWRASQRLGITPEAAAPAEVESLVQFGGRVRFRHPLVRSAIYRAAPESERREVHRALAEATRIVAPGTALRRRSRPTRRWLRNWNARRGVHRLGEDRPQQPRSSNERARSRPIRTDAPGGHFRPREQSLPQERPKRHFPS